MIDHHSVKFFEQQFQRQLESPAPATEAATATATATAAHLQLNPFELQVLPHLSGDVLDFGCGLGNLACAAAEQGCRVNALDGSPVAIAHLRERAAQAQLPLTASVADLRHYPLANTYDAVACIGLLMFFDGATAQRVLHELQTRVRPGGIMALNVLIDGTTFLDMFDPAGYCLFNPLDIQQGFAGWQLLLADKREFDAPGATVKRFLTVIARKPG